MCYAPEEENGSTRGGPADVLSPGLVFLEMLLWHSYRQDIKEVGEIVGLTTPFAAKLDEMLS